MRNVAFLFANQTQKIRLILRELALAIAMRHYLEVFCDEDSYVITRSYVVINGVIGFVQAQCNKKL